MQTSNYGPEPGEDLPLSRALWNRLNPTGRRHVDAALYEAVLDLERRTIELEHRLAASDAPPDETTPPPARWPSQKWTQD